MRFFNGASRSLWVGSAGVTLAMVGKVLAGVNDTVLTHARESGGRDVYIVLGCALLVVVGCIYRFRPAHVFQEMQLNSTILRI